MEQLRDDDNGMTDLFGAYTVYLAAAVDAKLEPGQHSQGMDWHYPYMLDPFGWMAGKLAPLTCFMPKAAFYNAIDGRGDEFLASVNFHALKLADLMVAFMDGETPSVGMPMEMLFAAYHQKPVIIVSNNPEKVMKSIYTRLFSAIVVHVDQFNLELVHNIYNSYKSNHKHYQLLRMSESIFKKEHENE